MEAWEQWFYFMVKVENEKEDEKVPEHAKV